MNFAKGLAVAGLVILAVTVFVLGIQDFNDSGRSSGAWIWMAMFGACCWSVYFIAGRPPANPKA